MQHVKKERMEHRGKKIKEPEETSHGDAGRPPGRVLLFPGMMPRMTA
jgi:hypothetical protein